jgi:hypothetical protein
MLNMKANIYIFCANRRRVSDRTRQSVVLCFFQNVRRVSNIASRKQLASARGLTLGEATSAVYLFPEWATPNATLGNDITQFFGLQRLPWHSSSSGFPVVVGYFAPTNPSDHILQT